MPASGNLLADEILWRAGMDPARRTPLNPEEVRALHTVLRSTLRQLERRGGSHMGDVMEERHPGGRCPATAPSCATASSAAGPPGGARRTSSELGRVR